MYQIQCDDADDDDYYGINEDAENPFKSGMAKLGCHGSSQNNGANADSVSVYFAAASVPLYQHELACLSLMQRKHFGDNVSQCFQAIHADVYS